MGSDEEYLDNLLKSISVGVTEEDSDLDMLLSKLDEELDNQLGLNNVEAGSDKQEDLAAEPVLDGLSDFGAEEEEPVLDGLADFGMEAEEEPVLDGLSDFGTETEAETTLDGLSDFGAEEEEPVLDGLSDFGIESEAEEAFDYDAENALDGLSDFGAKEAETEQEFDAGLSLDGLGDLFGEPSEQEAAEYHEDDPELAEINELLDKSDNHELVDDDMLSMLNMSDDDINALYHGSDDDEPDLFGLGGGEIGESSEPMLADMAELAELNSIPEKPAPEKKKKEKKVKEKKEKAPGGFFGKKKSAAPEEEAADIPEKNAEAEPAQKKKGLFTRFLDAITEEAEDSDDGKVKDENQQILDELDKEDAENSKKKKKKPKKEKKEKPVKEKKVKEKKPKKEKPPKEITEEESSVKEKPKKLSAAMIVPPVAFAATILAVLLIFVLLIPTIVNKNVAKDAFYKREYETVYQTLVGEKLNESEKEMYDQSKLLMQLQRKADSYKNYSEMGMQEEALHALIMGVQKYAELKPAADAYGITAYLDETYTYILNTLSENYGITEDEAKELAATEDKAAYATQLKELAGN